jgi:hypothetical protein
MVTPLLLGGRASIGARAEGGHGLDVKTLMILTTKTVVESWVVARATSPLIGISQLGAILMNHPALERTIGFQTMDLVGGDQTMMRPRPEVGRLGALIPRRAVHC